MQRLKAKNWVDLKLIPEDFIKEYKMFKDGKYGDTTAQQFAKMHGIGRSTLYKYIKLLDEQ